MLADVWDEVNVRPLEYARTVDRLRTETGKLVSEKCLYELRLCAAGE